MPSRTGRLVSWILAALLAVGFGLAALGKLSGAAVPMFEQWGYPVWFATLIGCAELVGAIALLIPKATRCAIYGLTVIMAGAVYTHLANGEGLQVLRPLIFAALLWLLWWLRRSRPRAAGSR